MLYVLEKGNDRVRAIEAGIIDTVAGVNDYQAPRGNGVATEIDLDLPRSITLSDDGVLYIGQRDRIHAVESGDARVAVGGDRGFSADGTVARGAKLGYVDGLAFSPDGKLHYADASNKLIRQIKENLGDIQTGEYKVPSTDGNQVFVFDYFGRHLETLDAYSGTTSGTTIYRFEYTDGLLEEVVDNVGRRTRIERDADSGVPVAIVGPFGHRTELDIYEEGSGGRDGYLEAVTDPAGQRYGLDYYQYDGRDSGTCYSNGSNCEGLLKAFDEPQGARHSFTYDEKGRLLKDSGPGGFSKTLSKSYSGYGINYRVDVSTARNATTSYSVDHFEGGRSRYTRTLPTGEKHIRRTDRGITTTHLPDGTKVVTEPSSDPRFELHAPVLGRMTMTTPSGQTTQISRQVEVSLTDEADIMSLERHRSTTTINGRTSESVWQLDPSDDTKTVTTTSPEGYTQTATYDALDRPTLVEVSGLEPTRYVYEDVNPAAGKYGRLIEMIQGDPSSTDARRWDYEHIDDLSDPGHGLLRSVTSPKHNASGQRDHTVSYRYDQALRTEQTTLPDQSRIGFGWDANSNMTSLTPPARDAHSFSYDGANRAEHYRPPTVSTGESDDAYQSDFSPEY